MAKLQVALLGSARSLQRQLDRLADRADTTTPEGLHFVLQGAARPPARSISDILLQTHTFVHALAMAIALLQLMQNKHRHTYSALHGGGALRSMADSVMVLRRSALSSHVLWGACNRGGAGAAAEPRVRRVRLDQGPQ